VCRAAWEHRAPLGLPEIRDKLDRSDPKEFRAREELLVLLERQDTLVVPDNLANEVRPGTPEQQASLEAPVQPA
jgi:hypothetical protein